MGAVDAVVLGAGIAGLTVARELRRSGLSVVVLEREELGGLTSRAAAGILDPFSEREERSPFLSMGIEALAEYPAFVDELEKATGLAVEFERRGVLYVALNEADKAVLAQRVDWQKQSGWGVEFWPPETIFKREPLVARCVQGGVFYRACAKVNAARLLEALTAACRQDGVEIRCGESAFEIDVQGNRVAGARTRRSFIECGTVVNATGSWPEPRVPSRTPLLVSPVRGQILILELPSSCEVHHILHSLRWAYAVPLPNQQLLVGSTLEENAGYDASVTAQGKRDILKRASELIAGIERFKILKCWAGLRPRVPHGMPVVGPTAVRGFYVAMGYFRSGILIAPWVAKRLARQIVEGHAHALLEAFQPEPVA